MAYPLVVGDEFRLCLFTRNGDQEAINECRIRVVPAIGSVMTDQVLADNLGPIWGPYMTSGFNTLTQYSGLTLRRLVGAGPQPRTKFSTAGAGFGTSTTATLPTQACGLISMYTEFGGKKERGRFYYPFVAAEWLQADGTLEPAFIGTTLGDIATELKSLQTIIAVGSIVGVRYGLHPDGGDWHEFTASKQHDRWATQKRRGGFGQQNRDPFQ